MIKLQELLTITQEKYDFHKKEQSHWVGYRSEAIASYPESHLDQQLRLSKNIGIKKEEFFDLLGK